MMRKTIKRWTGACLLGSALATGCSQFKTGSDDSPAWPGHVVTAPPVNRAPLKQPSVASAQPQLAKNGPPTATLPPVVPAPANTAAEAPINLTNFVNSNPSLTNEPGGVPSATVDAAAHSCFSHSGDYCELTGQIQHSRITKGWRLRYASVDEVDRYGGSVTLVEDAKLSGLNDGDLVHVRGRLVNHDESGIAPPYEVLSIQPIAKHQ